MSNATSDPPIPRVKGTGLGGGLREGLIYETFADPHLYLKIKDAPAVLATLNDVIGPLERLSESLSAATMAARREGRDSISLTSGDPALRNVMLSLLDIQTMFARPRPDPRKLPIDESGTPREALPDDPDSQRDVGGRGPRPWRGVGGDDSGDDQATVNIPCPHCQRLIQARLLKAPGSE